MLVRISSMFFILPQLTVCKICPCFVLLHKSQTCAFFVFFFKTKKHTKTVSLLPLKNWPVTKILSLFLSFSFLLHHHLPSSTNCTHTTSATTEWESYWQKENWRSQQQPDFFLKKMREALCKREREREKKWWKWMLVLSSHFQKGKKRREKKK